MGGGEETYGDEWESLRGRWGLMGGIWALSKDVGLGGMGPKFQMVMKVPEVGAEFQKT